MFSRKKARQRISAVMVAISVLLSNAFAPSSSCAGTDHTYAPDASACACCGSDRCCCAASGARADDRPSAHACCGKSAAPDPAANPDAKGNASGLSLGCSCHSGPQPGLPRSTAELTDLRDLRVPMGNGISPAAFAVDRPGGFLRIAVSPGMPPGGVSLEAWQCSWQK